jgi:peroxiredoxin
MALRNNVASMVIGLIALGLVTGGCALFQGAGIEEGVEIGKQAPDFTLATLDGKLLSLSDFRGKRVVLNFMTTWCPACQEEVPHLQELFEKQDEQEAVLIVVDIQETESVVSQYMQEKGYNFTVVLDSSGTVAQKYKVQFIPTTYFLDRQGVIREKKIGAFQSYQEITDILSRIE